MSIIVLRVHGTAGICKTSNWLYTFVAPGIGGCLCNELFQFAPHHAVDDSSMLCQEVPDEFLHVAVIVNPMHLRIGEDRRGNQIRREPSGRQENDSASSAIASGLCVRRISIFTLP